MDRIIVILVNIFLILFYLKGVKLKHMALTELKYVVIFVRIVKTVTLTLENVITIDVPFRGLNRSGVVVGY